MTLRPRRAALLAAALCAATSCGIPTTGVVEAGVPASGVVPTVRVYLVADGTLVTVPRRIAAPVTVEAALEALLRGPTAQERRKGLTTALAPTAAIPAALPTSAVAPTGAPGQAEPAAELLTVTTATDRVSIALSPATGKLTDLAASQLLCTATDALHTAAPDAAPLPITLTTPNDHRTTHRSPRCPSPPLTRSQPPSPGRR
ncbi:hypothetical protein [Streptomyces flavalbus]|uniref:GerMN domain-containing protein n=1 Tax=Streptomyces flavalbus TaxID=2665155 RepID=A0ABW2W0Q6_9ACTN